MSERINVRFKLSGETLQNLGIIAAMNDTSAGGEIVTALTKYVDDAENDPAMAERLELAEQSISIDRRISELNRVASEK